MMRNPEQTIGNLLDKQKVVYAPRKREGIKSFYLTTNTSSRHVGEFFQKKRRLVSIPATEDFPGSHADRYDGDIRGPGKQGNDLAGRGYDVLPGRSGGPGLLCVKIYSG